MIYICTALYEEAAPLIEKLKLKKNMSISKFQVFEGNDYRLFICGVGKIKASIAVTYIFSRFSPSQQDMLINIGICGASNKSFQTGEAFMINKIFDKDSNRSYYPDMLFKHGFKESSLVSTSTVQKDGEESKCFTLVDMEASGVYEAAIMFIKTNQVVFIKVVSDHLESKSLEKGFIYELMEKASEEIYNWLEAIKHWNSNSPSFTQEEKNILFKVVCNLKLSETMKNEFLQYLKYYSLSYGKMTDLLSVYENIQCKSRNEGKRYLAEIKERIIN